jgi:acetyl esterase
MKLISELTFLARLKCIALACLLAPLAQAQSWPAKPVRIVVPSPPSGAIDVAARIVGGKLSEYWAQPVVIENRPGASMIIGAEAVAKSAPDGYTLLAVHDGGMVMNTLAFKSLPYHPQRDFTPLSLMTLQPLVVLVNAGLGIRSVKELIAHARANPGKLNQGSGGMATALALELFNALAGTDIVVVPYKGIAQGLNSVMSGETQVSFIGTGSAAGALKSACSPSHHRVARRAFPMCPRWPRPAFPVMKTAAGWDFSAPPACPPKCARASAPTLGARSPTRRCARACKSITLTRWEPTARNWRARLPPTSKNGRAWCANAISSFRNRKREMPEISDEVRAVLDRAKKENAIQSNTGFTPAQMRANRAKRPAWLELEKREMQKIEDRSIAGRGGPLAIRIYTPKGANEGERPVCLFFHCGGFMFGNLDSDDSQCRWFADGSGCIMVSVDYRLAPENKFPAAYEDAITAWDWVVAHAREIGGDGKRFGVSGASAGGNLTAGVCRHARDSGGPVPGHQLIHVGAFNVYPLVPSNRARGEGGSDASYAGMVRDAYRSSEADRDDVRYSPLIATDYKNFPSATLILSECDGFVDEGLLYAEKLRGAGVAVEVHVAKGQIHHVFPWAGAFSMGPGLLNQGAAALKKALKV